MLSEAKIIQLAENPNFFVSVGAKDVLILHIRISFWGTQSI